MMADLLVMRAQQIERRDHNTEEALLQVQRHRDDNRERYNKHGQLREVLIEEGSLVLLHNTKRKTLYIDKLGFWWLGPYQVQRVYGNGAYLLEELDGTVFRSSVYRNQLKAFYLVIGEDRINEVVHSDPEETDMEELELPENKQLAGSEGFKEEVTLEEQQQSLVNNRDQDDSGQPVPDGMPFVVVILRHHLHGLEENME